MPNKEQILESPGFFEAYYRSELGELKATGNDNYQARCPFHEDKTPSLSVNLKTGQYKCFGCDAHGDIFSFHKQKHKVGFKETLEELARRAGVEDKPSGNFKNLSMKEFSLAKKLPLPFLEGQGVADASFYGFAQAVGFPYFKKPDRKKYDYFRFRFAGKAPNKFRTRKGDKISLYGLWRLPEIEEVGWYLIVEGETDALTCWLHDIPALGLPGKGNWRAAKRSLSKTVLQALQDRKVYVWQEPDALELPGVVAQDLPGLLVIPAPPEFKDLSEAHCQGRDIPALVEQLKAQARPPAPPLSSPVVEFAYNLSDLGNARRLVALHGQDLRYCHLNKKWYCWRGQVWEVDSTAQVERWAKDVPADLYREASDCRDFKEREARGKFALQCEDSRRILAMVRLAQSEPGVPILPSAFDAQPWLLNCANGTIDLTTGKLRPHDREDLLTCMSPVVYEPDGPFDMWERFLYQIMDVDRQPAAADRMVMFLQRSLGYAITGSTREQCLFVLHGGGANGKTTALNQIKGVLGTYAMHTPTETLLAKKRGGEIPTDVARLDGPRLVTASEVDRGRRLAESLVKELTGQDTVSARFLYGEYFDFKPQFKLFLSTNNKPVIRGVDHAIWRRIKTIPFNVRFGEGLDYPKDDDIADKLTTERPGILAWLVRGCLAWQQEGLADPEEVIGATAAYRAEMDMLADFIEDCCLIGPDKWAAAKDLYGAYTEWAESQGISEKSRDRLTVRSFGLALTERGYVRGFKGHVTTRSWIGIGLRILD